MNGIPIAPHEGALARLLLLSGVDVPDADDDAFDEPGLFVSWTLVVDPRLPIHS